MKTFGEDYSLKAYLNSGLTPYRPRIILPAWGATKDYSLRAVLEQGKNLDGFFQDIGNLLTEKLFKPATKIQFSKISIASVTEALKKVVRYEGAMAFNMLTAGTAAKARNQIFGLTGGEQASFDVIGKATRIGAVIAAVVVSCIFGGPAIMAAAGKAGAMAMAKLAALKTAGSFILKNMAMQQMMKITKGQNGELKGEIYSAAQNPELYNSLVDGVLYPTDEISDSDLTPEQRAPTTSSTFDDFPLTDTNDVRPPVDSGWGVTDFVSDSTDKVLNDLTSYIPQLIEDKATGALVNLLPKSKITAKPPTPPPTITTTSSFYAPLDTPVPLVEPIKLLPEPEPSLKPEPTKIAYQEASMGIFIFLGLAGALWAASRGKK